MIEFGTKVRDKQTGFTGIVIARAEYRNDPTDIGVQPTVGKDGKMPDIEWINEDRIVVVKAKAKAKKKRPAVVKKKAPKKRKKLTTRSTSRGDKWNAW